MHYAEMAGKVSCTFSLHNQSKIYIRHRYFRINSITFSVVLNIVDEKKDQIENNDVPPIACFLHRMVLLNKWKWEEINAHSCEAPTCVQTHT